MNRLSRYGGNDAPHSSDATSLSIGDLARATGVTVGTLRIWESRHGFPESRRTDSGHRRYDATQIAQVRDVVIRRDAGARLASAIESAVAAAAAITPTSVYAALVRDHPSEPRQRLRKSTLLGLSWACEDELAATAAYGHLFGAFQTEASFDAARPRWSELARTSKSTFAMADFPSTGAVLTPGPDRIERVPLAEDTPLRREWVVVNDSPELPLALAAWELSGQGRSSPDERFFETVWTFDPEAVRSASRTCATVAAMAGSARAAELVEGPLAGAAVPAPDLLTVGRLMHRAVAYVEAAARR